MQIRAVSLSLLGASGRPTFGLDVSGLLAIEALDAFLPGLTVAFSSLLVRDESRTGFSATGIKNGSMLRFLGDDADKDCGRDARMIVRKSLSLTAAPIPASLSRRSTISSSMSI